MQTIRDENGVAGTAFSVRISFDTTNPAHVNYFKDISKTLVVPGMGAAIIPGEGFIYVGKSAQTPEEVIRSLDEWGLIPPDMKEQIKKDFSENIFSAPPKPEEMQAAKADPRKEFRENAELATSCEQQPAQQYTVTVPRVSGPGLG